MAAAQHPQGPTFKEGDGVALEAWGQGAHHEIRSHLGIHHQGDGLPIARTVSVILCTVQLSGFRTCKAGHKGKRGDRRIALTQGSAAALHASRMTQAAVCVLQLGFSIAAPFSEREGMPESLLHHRQCRCQAAEVRLNCAEQRADQQQELVGKC